MALMLIALAVWGHAQRPAPEVWLCASGDAIAQLGAADDASLDALRGVAGLKLYIGQLSKTPPEQLRALAAVVARQGWAVSVELGGPGNPDWGDQAGERGAAVELRSLRHWIEAGGKIDFLDVDGPIRRLMGFSGWGQNPANYFTDPARAARETADFMHAVRAVLPEVQFFLLTNFPNWGWKGEPSYTGPRNNPMFYGDYAQVMTIALDTAAAAGVPFTGVTVDNPHGYLTAQRKIPNRAVADPTTIDWLARVRDLENTVRARGLTFNLIVNDEAGGNESAAAFSKGTLAMVDLYRNAGGQPDRWIVQSWYPYPKSVLPATDAEALGGLTLEVIARTHAPRP